MFIGVLDSGLGGLSVERQIRRQLPTAPIRYVADQACAPYGEKPLEQIRTRAELVVNRLIEDGAGTIVLACNSASAAALHHLRERHPDIQFVGMEPAVKPAVEQTRTGVIGVLATTATVEGELLARVVDQYARQVAVLSTPCAGWVEMVEDGLADSRQADEMVARTISPMIEAGADTLVLACTHYPFLASSIVKAAPEARLVDPAEAVARQVVRVFSAPGRSDGTEFSTTGDPVRFRTQLEVLLGLRTTVERFDLAV